MLKKTFHERISIETETLKRIATRILYMSARIIVYLASEIRNLNFWKTWKVLRADIYQDEVNVGHANDKKREDLRVKPFEPIPTSEYLRQYSPIVFWDTPEELKNKPDYFLSGADRLYWWDDSDEVRISEKTDKWLRKLADQYQTILNSELEPKETILEFQEFMELMVNTDNWYYRIYPFENMFYEFVANLDKKEYRAATCLIRKVSYSKKNREAGKVTHPDKNKTVFNKSVLGNEGRLEIKRLYALLANKPLRKKYFGF